MLFITLLLGSNYGYFQTILLLIIDPLLKISNISILFQDDEDSDNISIDTVMLKLNTQHLLEKKYDFEIISFGNITFNTNIQKRKQEPVTQDDDSSKRVRCKQLQVCTAKCR